MGMMQSVAPLSSAGGARLEIADQAGMEEGRTVTRFLSTHHRLSEIGPMQSLQHAISLMTDPEVTNLTVQQLTFALSRRMRLFRVRVPQHRQGTLGPGPGGLNLRQVFGLHVVAIEDYNGSITFELSSSTAVAEGDFLWAGVRLEQDDQNMRNLVDFVGSTDLAQWVHVARMPVFRCKALPGWYGEKIEILRRSYCVTVCAMERFGSDICFPLPDTVIDPSDTLYFAAASLKHLLQLTQWLGKTKGGPVPTDNVFTTEAPGLEAVDEAAEEDSEDGAAQGSQGTSGSPCDRGDVDTPPSHGSPVVP
mmetsp:Transcript_76632/g.216719  ORF Transcript_76632/g.216719 Transcript_76632/m.216719 type:complete len:306 (+) Transcript_76632:1-918(+)